MALTIRNHPDKPVINDPSFEVTTSLTEGTNYNNLRIRAEVYMGGRTGKIATIEQPKGLDGWDFKRLLDRFIRMPDFALAGSSVLQKPTLGSELLTGWSSSGSFTTFTVSGREITLADGAGSGAAWVSSNNLGSLIENDILVISFEHDYADTGTDPVQMFVDDYTIPANTQAAQHYGQKANKLTFVRITEDITTSYLALGNSTGNFILSTTATVKKITDFINDPCVYFQVKFTEYYENSSGVTTAGASSWSDTLLYIPALMPDGEEFKMNYLMDSFFNPDEMKMAVIRNVEIDDRLSPSNETLITVTAIDTTANTITFSELPPGLANSINKAPTNQEWLVFNIDSFNTGGFTHVGNYTLGFLLDGTGNETDGFGYNTISGFGLDTSWAVGDQVMFLNPFTYMDYGGSYSPDIEAADFPTLSPTFMAANALFKRSDGTWVSIMSLPGTAEGTAVAYSTAPNIYGPWTAVDDYLIKATDVNANYTGVFIKNVHYLTDENLYLTLMACYDSVAGKWHTSMVKFDEDFNNFTFYDKLIEEPTSSAGCIPGALFYANGYYYAFYVDRKTGDLDAEAWEHKFSKSTSYSGGFSEGTTLIIGSTTAGADADLRNKYYNSHVDGSTAFEYGGEIYIFIHGTSRHDESGTRANRQIGLAKFNTTTEELEFSKLGVVFPNFLMGGWPDSLWARDHGGAGAGLYEDNGSYYFSTSMNSAADDYKVIHSEIKVRKLFDDEYRFLNKGIRNGEALFRNEGHEMRVLFATDETYINAWDSEGLFNGAENNPGYGYIIINNITMGAATSIWEFAIYATRDAINSLMSEELNIQKISDKCFEDSRVLLYKGDLGPETMFFAGQSDKRHIVDRETYRNNNYEPRTISTQRRTIEKLRTGYQRQELRDLLKELISSEIPVWMIDNSLSAGYREIAVTSDEVLSKSKDELIQSEIDIEYYE